MEFVYKIEEVPKGGNDRPLEDVVIVDSGELEIPKDEEGKQEDDDVPAIVPPPAENTPVAPNPEVEAALDSAVEASSRFSFGALLFGFVFLAGCAALFVKSNGMQRVNKVLGLGKYRYRRTGDVDLEQ